MKPATPVLLATLLALLLVPAPVHAGADLSKVQATAFGSVGYLMTDARTGATLCDTDAVLTLDVGALTGAATWTARDCAATTSEAALFPAHCTDLCFLGCDVREEQIRCWGESTTPGAGWTYDELLLLRDGTVTLTRESVGPSGATRTELTGTLFVATWP